MSKNAVAARPRRVPKLDELSGRQKVAILLMAMGEERSTQVTRNFSPEELEAITVEIARMDRVPPELVTAVIEEWQETELAAQSLATGGFDYARRILESALGPQRAAQVLRRIEAQLRDNGGFHNLRNADPQQLSTVLRNEHPQTIALILSHLEPTLVAEVLGKLEPLLGSDVLFRMARMEKVLPEVLQVVERSMGNESSLSISQDMSSTGGPEAVAAVLNNVPGQLEKELLDGILVQDEALCEQIKNLMFTFADLTRLDDRALQRLLREVETRDLAMALKAAGEELKARILSVMSQRAVAALKDEIDMLGPVRMRDVETAQQLVVKAVRALEETGEIMIGGSADDMVA